MPGLTRRRQSAFSQVEAHVYRYCDVCYTFVAIPVHGKAHMRKVSAGSYYCEAELPPLPTTRDRITFMRYCNGRMSLTPRKMYEIMMSVQDAELAIIRTEMPTYRSITYDRVTVPPLNQDLLREFATEIIARGPNSYMRATEPSNDNFLRWNNARRPPREPVAPIATQHPAMLTANELATGTIEPTRNWIPEFDWEDNPAPTSSNQDEDTEF